LHARPWIRARDCALAMTHLKMEKALQLYELQGFFWCSGGQGVRIQCIHTHPVGSVLWYF
jgi:hypothetical protein